MAKHHWKGTTGPDYYRGDDSAEKISGFAGDDDLGGGNGDDIVSGGDGNDLIEGGAGQNRLIGGAGIDTVSYAYALGSVQIDLAAGTAFDSADGTSDQLRGFEIVIGSDHDDTISGSRRGDDLRGGTGADTLFGKGGDDKLHGGAGSDALLGGRGSDVIYGEGGDDRISWDGIDRVVGGLGNDTLMITNYVRQPIKIDLFRLSGTQIAGAVVGGFERVDASEAGAAVNVTGSKYNNLIAGSAHDDMLAGGGGTDRLTGGGGADKFVFDGSVVGPARTTVTDFTSGQGDKVDLRELDAVMGGTDDSFSFIGASAFHGIAGELRAFTSHGGQVVQGDLDGNGVADFSINLAGAPVLQATDFLL